MFNNSKKSAGKGNLIRTVYMYGVSLICLVITIIASIGLVNLVINNFVFKTKDFVYYAPEICSQPVTKGDKSVAPTAAEIKTCEEKQSKTNDEQYLNTQKRELATDVAMLLIALPLWIFHWKLIQKESH